MNIARLAYGRVEQHHTGWAYDAYAELETLDAGRTITVAEVDGPAVINCLHSTMHILTDEDLDPAARRAIPARGVVLEVRFDGYDQPAVCVPLADFFADGCGGRADYFSTPFVEKAPASYNCHLPMPFRRSAHVTLRNDTEHDLRNYSSVEVRRLPDWDDSLGYLHATWRRAAFQLDPETDEHVFRIDGTGHLVGSSWSICTDDPFFAEGWFVTEGNVEIRLDGEDRPRFEYLGIEDAFGFSWGFLERFAGTRIGMAYLHPRDPLMVSLYRFRDTDRLLFDRSLDIRIDWTNEWRSERFQEAIAPLHPDRRFLPEPRSTGRGWVDYATTHYWYQREIGFPHAPLPELSDRCASVLHPNPRG